VGDVVVVGFRVVGVWGGVVGVVGAGEHLAVVLLEEACERPPPVSREPTGPAVDPTIDWAVQETHIDSLGVPVGRVT
jgi:hypothetical protein